MSLLTNLYTLEAAPAQSTGMLGMLLPIILMVAVFYFVGIRPQKKQEKEAKAMRDGLAIGDEIVTIGGIVGRIVNKREDSIVIETSSDRTKIKIETWAIKNVVKKANDPKEEQKPATFKVKK